MMSPLADFAFDLVDIACAVAAIVMAVWVATHKSAPRRLATPTIVALSFTALWAMSVFGLGSGALIGIALISACYIAWLALLYGLFANDARDKSVSPIRPVVLALGLVEVLQLVLLGIRLTYAADPGAQALITPIAILFRLLACTGALVLVHNLYVGASREARERLRWPAAALATLWLYDLNLYTIIYLMDETPRVLIELRGLAALAMMAMLALGLLRSEADLKFQPSRSFAFRSFSLLVIGAYLLVMVAVAQGLAYAGSELARTLQVGFVALASALALAFLPSRRLRGWLRVKISKNLFQHRYDYRAEWLRFTDTIGRAGPQSAPLHERAVQAIADITDSRAGLLLTPREEGGLALDARWQWPGLQVPGIAMDALGQQFFEVSHFILDLDDVRAGQADGIPQGATPRWLLQERSAWALVPLLHYEKLVGVVVLDRPAVARRLDWEDFDLLRVIGRQLASYLAEQSSQDALGDAQRFDEFNRRMAFVMHDIKNLASQLSLLARNAEKHADKPEFRADMIITLKNSTDKLQALLARLGRYGASGSGTNERIALDKLVADVARVFVGKHQIVTPNREPCTVTGDREALEQALVHLVQNAVEASEDGSPVFLDMRVRGSQAIVEVIDSGCGMSPEFVRTRLFKPFHSSKNAGFGIGAFEARELIRAMGGSLDVESREGIGTRFVAHLPLAEASGLLHAVPHDRLIKPEVA